MEPKRKTIKKRKYSRLGCRECKRRKLKCDEEKPACWQCAHLKKVCIYDSPPNLSTKPAPIPGYKAHPINSFSVDSNTTKDLETPVSKQGPRIVSDMPELTAVSGVTSFADPILVGTVNASTGTINGIHQEDLLLAERGILDDVSLLASDLQDVIATTDFSEIKPLQTPLDGNFSPGSKREFLVSSVNVSPDHVEYLRVFYDKVSFWIFPNSINSDASIVNDIYFRHAAEGSSFLLSAMLAIAAKHEYILTRERRHEEKRLSYIQHCLRLLNDIFHNAGNIKDNIEPLILTVILLTVDSSSFKSGEWKVHFKGAKDLLIKYISLYTAYNSTPTIELARLCFGAIECVATVSGIETTIATEEELDLLLDEKPRSLVNIGLLLPSGFNVFFGYSVEVIVLFKKFVRFILGGNIGDCVELIALAHKARQFRYVQNEFGLVTEAIAADLHRGLFQNNGIWYSLFDVSQQLHVEAILIAVYQRVASLSKDHALVMDSCDRIFKYTNWMFTKNDTVVEGLRKDYRLLMLQSAFVVCGEITKSAKMRHRIRDYLSCLVTMGIGLLALETLEKQWSSHPHEVTKYVPFS